MKTIVVAFDQRHGIGAHNDLLWLRDLPSDLKHFRELTSGHTVIMGRKTFESIGRPLPNRQNIVVSHSFAGMEGVEVARSIEEAYSLAKGDIYVIGGAQIYEEALPTVDEIQATEVLATFEEATVFFPELDPTIWQEVSRQHHNADNLDKYPYDFVHYTRVS
jgi:dihydrofolate reductase